MLRFGSRFDNTLEVTQRLVAAVMDLECTSAMDDAKREAGMVGCAEDVVMFTKDADKNVFHRLYTTVDDNDATEEIDGERAGLVGLACRMCAEVNLGDPHGPKGHHLFDQKTDGGNPTKACNATQHSAMD